MLESLTGIQAVEIGFKGASDVMTELISERLDFYVSDPLVADPFLRQGNIRALAVGPPGPSNCAAWAKPSSWPAWRR
jgi:tripartite-type tricarboxylate transporter receptor subunit TctC